MAFCADLHGRIPAGPKENVTVLAVVGDVLPDGSLFVQEKWWHGVFLPWIAEMKKMADLILIVPGNHDFLLEKEMERMRKTLPPAVVMLGGADGVVVDGVYFWGFPWIVLREKEEKEWAFQEKEEEIREKLKKIPKTVQVLLAHSPPAGTRASRGKAGEEWGSTALRAFVEERKKTLKMYVCGHVHEGRGEEEIEQIPLLNVAGVNPVVEKEVEIEGNWVPAL